MKFSPLRTSAAIGLLTLTSGCYDVSTEGDVTRVTFRAWTYLVALVLAVGFARFAAFLAWRAYRNRSERVGLLLAAAGIGVTAALCGFFSFGFMQDELVLTSEEVYDHLGFPWEREKRGFRFADVERVVLAKETRGNGRRRTTDVVWRLNLRDGGLRILRPGDLWIAATDDIAACMERAGVRMGPDPRTLGLASDDPFVVTIAGIEARIDSPIASERMTALHMGGFLGRMTSRDHEEPLLATLRSGVDPKGSWTLNVRDGPRCVHIACEFDGAGGLRQSMAHGDQGGVALGSYSITENELTLEFDGSMTSLLFSRQ